ncbi:MAG: recombinase, partial [Actinomycetospora sp.]|nr:recombinase [Actinomycetospora sp.]
MTQVSAPTLAREYLRVSVDRSGRARSVDEQHADNARAAESHGWALGEPYTDNSVSASRYSRKPRGGFAELMADLDADRFGASVLILWESSRGSRKVSEWAALIEACERRDVSIHVTKDGQTYDPAKGRDVRSLIDDANDAQYESSKVSDRTKRSNAVNAAAGRPHGRVAFGFQRRYDPRTKTLVAQEPHPQEAPVVRELFARIAGGHSLKSIARDFEARGVRTRSGVPFSAANLRSLAVRDAYAGRRVHDPGRANGTTRSPNAQTVTGTWESLVSEGDFLAVQRILSDPSRRTNRPGRGVHLLSMIALCAACGGPLSAAFRADRGKRRQYQCHTGGHVRVDADDLDGVATEAMLGYLSRADVHEALTASEDEHGDEIEAVRGEIAALRVRLDELADAVAAGAVSVGLA